MAAFAVRQALLDDTSAVSELARSHISAWQRMAPDGSVENVSYDALTIYERWLHGGPWMSVETGALQLSRVLMGGGIPIVATYGERIIGYTEGYPGTEPQPYGLHLHIGLLVVYTEEAGADDTLFEQLLHYAREHGIKRITANCAVNDERTKTFYERHNMQIVTEVRRLSIKAKAGQVFYKAVEHLDPDPAKISGWHLDIGRLGSAQFQWESLWHQTWESIPQIRQRRTHRLHLQAAGNDAYVFIRQQLYRPRTADVFCWTPKPPSGQLITAIRDWAQREGYRTLVMPTIENSVKTLGLEAEPDGYREYVYAVDV